MDIDKLTQERKELRNGFGFSTLLDIDKLTQERKELRNGFGFSTLLDIDNDSIIRYVFFCSATTCHL